MIISSPPTAAYMRQWTGSALVQVMACHLFGPKPLPKPMLACCQLFALLGMNFSGIWIWILSFSFKKMHLKMSSANMAAILSKGRWVNCILNHSMTLGHHRLLRLNHKDDRNIPTSSQYHCYWCHADTNSGGISNHSIDLAYVGNSSPSSRRINTSSAKNLSVYFEKSYQGKYIHSLSGKEMFIALCKMPQAVSSNITMFTFIFVHCVWIPCPVTPCIISFCFSLMALPIKIYSATISIA